MATTPHSSRNLSEISIHQLVWGRATRPSSRAKPGTFNPPRQCLAPSAAPFPARLRTLPATRQRWQKSLTRCRPQSQPCLTRFRPAHPRRFRTLPLPVGFAAVELDRSSARCGLRLLRTTGTQAPLAAQAIGRSDRLRRAAPLPPAPPLTRHRRNREPTRPVPPGLWPPAHVAAWLLAPDRAPADNPTRLRESLSRTRTTRT